MTDPAGTEARAPWRATVLTLFPELFPGPLAASLAGEALQRGLWALDTVAIREFGHWPAPGRRRYAGRRRRRHGHARGRRGRSHRRRQRPQPAGAAPLSVAPRRAAHPGHGARAGGGPRRAPAGRPLRGHRRARHRGARPARGLDRRLRAVGRRAGGHGADRRGGAAAAGRGRPGRLARRGELRGRPARVPPLHPPARMGGPPDPRRPALRRPQAHRRSGAAREAERLTAERRPDLLRARPAKRDE